MHSNVSWLLAQVEPHHQVYSSLAPENHAGQMHSRVLWHLLYQPQQSSKADITVVCSFANHHCKNTSDCEADSSEYRYCKEQFLRVSPDNAEHDMTEVITINNHGSNCRFAPLSIITDGVWTEHRRSIHHMLYVRMFVRMMYAHMVCLRHVRQYSRCQLGAGWAACT